MKVVFADKFLAACDVPGIKKIIPKEWYQFKEFVGLSPFKNEKTPSFTVNDEKEFYHCFATSEHGNIFDFVMKIQKILLLVKLQKL